MWPEQRDASFLCTSFLPIFFSIIERHSHIVLPSFFLSQNHIGVFIASRGLIGFGLTFAQNAAPILITGTLVDCFFELGRPSHSVFFFFFRTGLPNPESWAYFLLQLFMVLWINHRCLDDVRNVPNQQFVELAYPLDPSGHSVYRASLFDFLGS